MSPTEPQVHEWIQGTARFPVYYEDTDFSGYVYHANYLKYFERGREELVGIPFVRELYERGLHYVVARVDISYHRPAGHGDLIEVSTRMRLSAAPLTIVHQEAHRISLDGSKPTEKVVSAEVKLVAVDRDGRSTRVPDDVLERLRALGVTRAP